MLLWDQTPTLLRWRQTDYKYMIFPKKTLRDIDVKDKTVLVRADYNVPLHDGQVADDYRIRKSVPTLLALLEQRCKVVIVSHLGRPKGEAKPELSLQPVASVLSELLETEVRFAHDCVGEEAQKAVKELQHGQVLLLENLRFHYEEEVDDKNFAEQLAGLADVFVQDGFGVVHRAHASTSAVTDFLPSVAGELLELEYRTLKKAISHPKRPLATIIGGAKIGDKIQLIDNFIEQSDTLIIGGAMANTFLMAKGINTAKSLVDSDEIETANKLLDRCLEKDVSVILPLHDVAVAKEVDENQERREVSTEELKDDDVILDLGEKSIRSITHNLKEAGTIIWNGPLGMTELPNFSHGSESVARFIADNQLNAVVGGGDTATFIHELGLGEGFAHVSTGGGASLELLAGKKLPGVEALLDK